MRVSTRTQMVSQTLSRIKSCKMDPTGFERVWHIYCSIDKICNELPFVYAPLLAKQAHMMTSSNGNIFRVTGHLYGEFKGPRRHKAQWRGALIFSLICVWVNDWVNNREAGDLRLYRTHYDIIVIYLYQQWHISPMFFAPLGLNRFDVYYCGIHGEWGSISRFHF